MVKVNIYLKNIADTDSVDEVYKTILPGGVPTRRTVGVAVLSHDALVRIDADVANAEGTPPMHNRYLFVKTGTMKYM